MKDRYFELKNLIGAILLLSVVLWGCKKGDQTLGIDLLPGVKILKTLFLQDKTSISTSIVTDAKIRVDHPAYNLLGSFNDPVFGRTDASFAAQFRLPNNPAYSATSSIDSIILRMSYKVIYGDTLSSQTLQVYELMSGLSFEAKYLSSFNVKNLASTEPIGTGSFIPKFRSTDSTKTDTIVQAIRIPLNKSFGTRLLGIDSLNMISSDVFLKVFKGLYIGSSPLSRKGTLVSIINSPIANTGEFEPTIVLYYHDAKRDTLSVYQVTANSANVSSYVHEYAQARFFPNLDPSVPYTDSLIYVQPTGGIKSKILIPSLSAWKDSVNFIFDKATLTIHVDTIMSDYRRYSIPSRLYLMRDSTNVELFPKDATISNAYYGGYYNAATATYSFNVTQHLQDLIAGLKNGKMENEGFYLVSSDRNNSAQRVVLKGNGSKWAKPELNITYTKYK